MNTIACVKVGTKYGPEYVRWLQRMTDRWLPTPHRFVCITDAPSDLDCETIRSILGLTGWWAKLQIFRDGFWAVDETVLYLDLDVAVVSSLADLFEHPGEFLMHRDFQKPVQPASAVMLLRSNPRPRIWDAWQEYQAKHPVTPRGVGRYYGDQDFIAGCWRHSPWDVFPEKWVVSYRMDSTVQIPFGAKVVCFHGLPKPHAATSHWIRSLWSQYAA